MPKPVSLTIVIGTRPEAIKLMPLIAEAKKQPDRVHCTVISSGQHRDMLADTFEALQIEADHDLDMMLEGQVRGGPRERTALTVVDLGQDTSPVIRSRAGEGVNSCSSGVSGSALPVEVAQTAQLCSSQWSAWACSATGVASKRNTRHATSWNVPRIDERHGVWLA